MRKVYLDRTELTGAINVFLKDTEFISAGTTIFSMSVYDRMRSIKNMLTIMIFNLYLTIIFHI